MERGFTGMRDWLEANALRMKRSDVSLSAKQRACVETAVRTTCRLLGWGLLAVNVRTNHVHAVVSAPLEQPDRVLNALKSYSTREMRKSEVWQSRESPWSDKGSTRYLWNDKHIKDAVEYVINGQGGDLPEFD